MARKSWSDIMGTTWLTERLRKKSNLEINSPKEEKGWGTDSKRNQNAMNNSFMSAVGDKDDEDDDKKN